MEIRLLRSPGGGCVKSPFPSWLIVIEHARELPDVEMRKRLC